MPTLTVIPWLLTSLKQPIQKYKQELLSGCAGMDWDGLIAYAARHGLAPLLCRQLQSDDELWAAVPRDAQEQLEQRYLYNAQRNLLLYHRFLKLAKLFAEKKIPLIALKGVDLAHFIYTDRALRPMGDIDILIHESDLDRVETVMAQAGYERHQWPEPVWLADKHFHWAYTHRDTAVTVEVHWHVQRPSTPNRMDIDDIWRAAQPATIASIQMFTMSPEHLLLHQCLHMVTHSYQIGLRAFYDVAAIVDCYRDSMDWDQLIDCTAHWGAGKAIYLGLYLAREFFGCIPATVVNKFDPGNVAPAMVEAAREQVLTWQSNEHSPSLEFSDLWEQGHDRYWLQKFWQRVFIPPEMLAALYPVSAKSWRVYLYYPVRIFALLKVYPQFIWQILRKDQAAIARVKHADRVKDLEQWLSKPGSAAN